MVRGWTLSLPSLQFHRVSASTMCGIAGFVHALDAAGTLPGVDREVLRAMASAIAHRGPDDEGLHVGEGVGLAFRRLAIVDVATGKQPMSTSDGALTVVFNGEIYNHRDLRKQLAALGHQFQTAHSDTETILHGYRAWGAEGFCQRAAGQFAFALWDTNARRLILARDRVGKKPLFVAHDAKTLAFASELKALAPLRFWSRELDHEAIWDYLSLQYVPDPATIYRGVRKLPPGHYAVWDQASGRLDIQRYWRLEYEPKLEPSGERAMEDWLDEGRALLDAAVRSRLESEVPLGCFLSGGIDSSAVLAYMRRHETGRIRTFSIGFEEERFNELPYAREMSQKFATEHHEFIIEPNAAEVLPQMIQHFGEPFADPAALPTWYLSKLAREHVTVALNGDGGDESFAGYPRTLGFNPVPWWPRVPRPLRSMLAMALRPIRGLPHRPRAVQMVDFVNHQSLVSPDQNYANMMAYCLDDTKSAIASRGLLESIHGRDSLREISIGAMNLGNARARADRLLASDIATYLPGALLTKVDRMSMAFGVEARSPFLDHRLMEFAARLPVEAKVPRHELKVFLKTMLRADLPSEILDRPKAGFAVPTGQWFRGPLKSMLRDLLLDRTAQERGLFSVRAVQRLVDDHTSGSADHKRPLWVLLNLELFMRHARLQ